MILNPSVPIQVKVGIVVLAAIGVSVKGQLDSGFQITDCPTCDAYTNDILERQRQKATEQNILSQSNQQGGGNQGSGNQGGGNQGGGNQGGANTGGANRTPHGDDRKRQADQGDAHRQVGDANRTIRDGQRYRDTQTGNNVYVRGNRVVITNKDGVIVTQFKNSRTNTRERLRSGRWEPFDEELQ